MSLSDLIGESRFPWPAWLLHFPDSDPLSVSFCPALPFVEALARYPQTIAAPRLNATDRD